MVLSRAEAEYVVATLATQECIWLTRLIQGTDKNYNIPVLVFCYKESATKLPENPVFHTCTKHIDIPYHFVRKKALGEEIELRKIESEKQVANIFTKALSQSKFERFHKKLGVVDCMSALRGSVII